MGLPESSRYPIYNETHPRRNDTIRLDFNLTSKLTAWARYIHDYDLDVAATGVAKNSQGQWAPNTVNHPDPGHSYGVGITYTISPTMVNEFIFGKGWWSWDYYPRDPAQFSRSSMANPPSFDNFATDPNFLADVNNVRPTLSNGSQNLAPYIPTVTFGGGQEPNEWTINSSACSTQCPFTAMDTDYSFSDSLSKVEGKHNLRAGIYIERSGSIEPTRSSNGNIYLGAYSFSSGGAPMIADIQDGFANTYAGNFNSYQEGQRAIANTWFWQVEAFVQDNWRVNRRLTLDLGVRFYHPGPGDELDHNPGQGFAAFLLSAYNAASAERIYYPGCTISTANGACPAADQYAIDLATGYKTFYAAQGTLVPAAVGGYSTTPNPYPGMVIAGIGENNGGSLPGGMYTVPFASPTARVGFAWDVFGNGRTAVRGGFGQYINRPNYNTTNAAIGASPVEQTRTVYYTNVNSIATNASALLANSAIAPLSTSVDLVGPQQNESFYNGSFMVQQNVGFSTVVQAAWVFGLRRHIAATTPRNYMPNFAQYNSAWASPMAQYLLNPAKNGGLTQGNANGLDLSANYFYGPSLCGTCLSGLSSVNSEGLNLSQDSHSLQVAVRRNMTRHLSYGLAYTWLKSMGVIGAIGGQVGSHSAIFPDQFRNWGPSYQGAPHTIVVNYVYEAPNLGQKLNFKPLGWITDHWTWSGITQWRSDVMTGVPGISFSGTNSTTNPQENWTGGTEGARMFVVGNYHLSSIGQSPSFAGGTPVATSQGSPATSGYGPNGTPGNQLINEAAWQIPFPCSATPAANPIYGVGETMECFGNAGSGSLIEVPGTQVLNFDMTFSKNFPIKSEKRMLIFRAEMYNIFNHTQFSGYNISPTYDWSNWKNGIPVQTSNSLGRYSAALNPRQISLALRFQF